MNRQEIIDKLIGYARCSQETAIAYLERFNWSYEKAANAYWLEEIIPYEYLVENS